MTMGQYNQMAAADNGAKKKKVAIIGVSSLILVAMVVGVAVGVSSHGKKSSGGGSSDSTSGQISTSVKAIKSICEPTDYKETCVESLTSAAGNSTDPKQLIKVGFEVAVNHVKDAIQNSTALQDLVKDNPKASTAVKTCLELLDLTVDDIQVSLDKWGEFDMTKLGDYIEDIRTWLSAGITNQDTCVDQFQNVTGDSGEKMKQILKSSRELTANGLDMVTEISSILSSLQIPGINRRLLSESVEEDESEFPSWVGAGQRRLLQATPATITPNVIVAKDGSGKYKTIKEAIKEIPNRQQKTRVNNNTFVIYIKEGVYNEQIILDKYQHNVMFIGDGATKTKITGSKNYVDGTETFHSATLAVIGWDFVAKDIGIENTAGAIKHQAVALRVQSDRSIFYNCQIDGYQDTLYTHGGRQFYRDCTVSGTIDFVFGDASVVLQNCKLLVRKPLDNQQCIVTAQGRTQKSSKGAIILQNTTITADASYLPVKSQFKTFLGRPWKEYSRTIIMQSQIDDIIQPQGWLPWMGNFALNTCFYAEYNNRGPGSVQTDRVTWRGIKKLTPEHAADFTAGKFLTGDKWIKPYGVPYTSGMMNV